LREGGTGSVAQDAVDQLADELTVFVSCIDKAKKEKDRQEWNKDKGTNCFHERKMVGYCSASKY
jgi:hypothetical protein